MMLCKISFLLVATLLANSEASLFPSLIPQIPKPTFSSNINVGSLSAAISLGGKGSTNSSSSTSPSSAASQASNLSSTVSNSTSNCSSSNPLLVEKAKAALGVLTSQVSQVSAILGQGLASARAQGEGAEVIAQYFEQLQNSTNDILGQLTNLASGNGTGAGNSTSNSTSEAGFGSGSGSNPIASIIQGLQKAGGLLVSVAKLALDIKKQIISGALEAVGAAAGAAGPEVAALLEGLSKLVSGGNGTVSGDFAKNGLANAPHAGPMATAATLLKASASTVNGLVAGMATAI